MQLKRIFENGKLTAKQCMDDVKDEAGDVIDRIFNHPKFLGAGGKIFVRVQRLSDEWHVSTRVFEKGIAEGWMSAHAGKIILHTEDKDDDVVFNIASTPKKGVDGKEDRTRNFYDCRVIS